MSIYIPMSLFMAMIISLYRSFLKIKEIVIYGTVFSVLCISKATQSHRTIFAAALSP